VTWSEQAEERRLIGRPPGSFALCESAATANVLSVRKRSDSNNNNKAPIRNGNQPLVLQKSSGEYKKSVEDEVSPTDFSFTLLFLDFFE